MRRILFALLAYVIASLLAFPIGLLLGNAPFAWALTSMGPIVVAVLTFFAVKPKASTPLQPAAAARASELGAADFVWGDLAVYRTRGVFTFRGQEFPISKVTNVSYKTSGNRGCMGGTHYTIHVHMNDMGTPRITFGSGNILHSGNAATEENYERLCIALGCR